MSLRSKISGLLATLLIISVFTTSVATAHSVEEVTLDLEDINIEVKFDSFEDIPKELLDPFHPDAINQMYIYGDNSSGGEFQTFVAIPGIGQVAITVTGAIVIGGATIAVGSWLYNKVTAYFAERAYEKAKKDGAKTDNHSSQNTSTSTSLPTTGKALSSKDLKDSQGVKQRRYYDKNGKADVDIDYRHAGNFKFPHRHTWTNGVRSKH